jgi:hypothetical protein
MQRLQLGFPSSHFTRRILMRRSQRVFPFFSFLLIYGKAKNLNSPCRSCSLFSHAEQMLSSAVESQPSPPSLFSSVWTSSCEKGWGCQHLKYPQSHDPDKANRNPAGIIHLNKILRLAISYSISNDASAKYA